MDKKTNTVIFVLVATVFNIIVTVLSFLLLLLIFSKFLYPLMPESSVAWVLPVIFLVSIVVSFFVYRFVVKILIKKMGIDKYLSPVFKSPRKS